MSKRTLDAFLIAPTAANAKKAKKTAPSQNARRLQPRGSSLNEPKPNGVEVVDLDEVIDIGTPSPSPSGLHVIPDLAQARSSGNGKNKVEAVAAPSIRQEHQTATAVNTVLDASASNTSTTQSPPNTHEHYPFPIPILPSSISQAISAAPVKQPKVLNHLPHLDLLTFEPYLGAKEAREYGEFLRRELPFYRVEYKLTRFGKVTDIRTPRFTTVFGVDETSRFAPDGSLVDSVSGKPIPKNKYKTAKPRPIPSCLDELRKSVEAATGTTYNYALVNYYATGSDSISYHSDDEHFLEKEPAIASFSFLGVRDFLLKHKPPVQEAKGKSRTVDGSEMEGNDLVSPADIAKAAASPLKFALRPGTLILMRGTTQSNWLHSIPKRAGDGGGGRINITFRRNMTVGGTENYYRYNVGTGKVWKWDETTRQMSLMEGDAKS